MKLDIFDFFECYLMAKMHLFPYFVPDVGVIGAAKSSVGVTVETRFLGWPNARGCRRVNF